MHRDPLLEALIDKLPEPGKPWPQADRDVWFTLMRNSFDLVYGRDGQAAPKPLVTDLPKLPLVGDDSPPSALPGEWHIDAAGVARAPDGEEAPLAGFPRNVAVLDLRPGSDGRLDTVIWADGTWPASHVRSRGINLLLPKSAEKSAEAA